MYRKKWKIKNVLFAEAKKQKFLDLNSFVNIVEQNGIQMYNTKEKYTIRYIDPKQERKNKINRFYNKILCYSLITGILFGASYCANQCDDSRLVKKIRKQDYVENEKP